MKSLGRKEVAESVVLAALCTLAAGVVQLGLDLVREVIERRAKAERKRKKSAAKSPNGKES